MKTDVFCLLPCALLIAALLAAASLPAAAQNAPSAVAHGLDGIAAALEPFVDGHSLAGAVTLVADRDKVLSLDAIGYADIAHKLPMRADTMFWIASQSKPVTATALMMLVDEGKLRLDDPVEKYLPEFRGQWLAVEHDNAHQMLRKPAHPITVREILSHTSGLPFSSPMEQPTLDLLPLDIAVKSYAMTPLQFEPGSKYQYANAGINTAGRLIEVLSGMPYAAFLQTRLFKPLGMKDTTFWPSKAQLARLATSYKPNAGKTGLEETTVTQLKYPLDDRTRQPMPAGGLFSTASDMARFCQMVLNGGVYKGRRYVSEAAVAQMTGRQTGALPEGYGLGWSTGDGSFGHGGAYATNMTIAPQKGLILIYMVQCAGFAGNGDQALGVFQRTAEARFGTAHP